MTTQAFSLEDPLLGPAAKQNAKIAWVRRRGSLRRYRLLKTAESKGLSSLQMAVHVGSR